MLTLAFDTSTDIGSVAVGSAAGPISQSSVPAPATASESVLPAIRELLAKAGVALGDLEAIAVGSGPGSFTGLRIGAALAKGLCFALDCPLFAYSSLSAVVAGLPVEGRVCAVLDAGNDRVFAATFGSTAPLREIAGPRVWEVGALIRELQPLQEWTFAGAGAIRYAERLAEEGGRILARGASSPAAGALVRLVHEQDAGRVADLGSWQPEYLLASAAERAREAKPSLSQGSRKAGPS